MTRQDYLDFGFKELPHFTISGSLIFDLGRNRQLSVGSACTPNEVIYLCEVDSHNPKKITDLVCLHNYDYDGYMTIGRLSLLLKFFNKNNFDA